MSIILAHSAPQENRTIGRSRTVRNLELISSIFTLCQGSARSRCQILYQCSPQSSPLIIIQALPLLPHKKPNHDETAHYIAEETAHSTSTYVTAAAKFNERIAWRPLNSSVSISMRVGLCVRKGHMTTMRIFTSAPSRRGGSCLAS